MYCYKCFVSPSKHDRLVNYESSAYTPFNIVLVFCESCVVAIHNEAALRGFIDA